MIMTVPWYRWSFTVMYVLIGCFIYHDEVMHCSKTMGTLCTSYYILIVVNTPSEHYTWVLKRSGDVNENR